MWCTKIWGGISNHFEIKSWHINSAKVVHKILEEFKTIRKSHIGASTQKIWCTMLMNFLFKRVLSFFLNFMLKKVPKIITNLLAIQSARWWWIWWWKKVHNVYKWNGDQSMRLPSLRLITITQFLLIWWWSMWWSINLRCIVY